jgi:mRNA interferase RelE/StbE
MAKYQVVIRKSANKELAKIDKKDRNKISAAIDRLEYNPRPENSKKMIGISDCWRLRVGHFRVIYLIIDRALYIEIVRIAHRREAYRK